MGKLPKPYEMAYLVGGGRRLGEWGRVSQEIASGHAEDFIVWSSQSKEKPTSYYQADL